MPPAKLPEDWKPQEGEGQAPPATDFDKQQAPVPYTGEFKSEAAPEAAPAPQQLTSEGLYAYGQKQLADRAGAPQTNFDAANKSLNMTPQEQALYQRHLTNFYGTGGVDNSDGSRSPTSRTDHHRLRPLSGTTSGWTPAPCLTTAKLIGAVSPWLLTILPPCTRPR